MCLRENKDDSYVTVRAEDKKNKEIKWHDVQRRNWDYEKKVKWLKKEKKEIKKAYIEWMKEKKESEKKSKDRN